MDNNLHKHTHSHRPLSLLPFDLSFFHTHTHTRTHTHTKRLFRLFLKQTSTSNNCSLTHTHTHTHTQFSCPSFCKCNIWRVILCLIHASEILHYSIRKKRTPKIPKCTKNYLSSTQRLWKTTWNKLTVDSSL